MIRRRWAVLVASGALVATSVVGHAAMLPVSGERLGVFTYPVAIDLPDGPVGDSTNNAADGSEPTPEPPTTTPEPTAEATPSPMASPEPSTGPTASPDPPPPATPEPAPTPTPEPSPTPEPTPEPSPAREPTPEPSPAPDPSPSQPTDTPSPPVGQGQVP